MKVLDLQCAHQHGFEGWLGSEDDFSRQREAGLLSCPLCGSDQVEKRLSAPRLNLRFGRGTVVATAAVSEPKVPSLADDTAIQGRLLSAIRQVVASTEDVGERFADEARAMHHGDIEQRSIRGRTSPDVAMELIEEGIEVLPLPDIPGIKETLQ